MNVPDAKIKQMEQQEHLLITEADLDAAVEMGKINDGYFSRPDVAAAFIEKGIVPVLNQFGTTVSYAGFGGGEGYLTDQVAQYLGQTGRQVCTLVVDANRDYLDKAAARGLKTLCADIADVALSDIDLVTMRAVNHYSNLVSQRNILAHTRTVLAPGGLLVSQNLSGPDDAFCDMASELSRIPTLGRVDHQPDVPHICAEQMFVSLLEQAGFIDIRHRGYAPSIDISPAYYWVRFNAHHHDALARSGDRDQLARLNERHALYMTQANKLIASFLQQACDEARRLIRRDGDSFTVSLTFPVFSARRPARSD